MLGRVTYLLFFLLVPCAWLVAEDPPVQTSYYRLWVSQDAKDALTKMYDFRRAHPDIHVEFGGSKFVVNSYRSFFLDKDSRMTEVKKVVESRKIREFSVAFTTKLAPTDEFSKVDSDISLFFKDSKGVAQKIVISSGLPAPKVVRIPNGKKPVVENPAPDKKAGVAKKPEIKDGVPKEITSDAIYKLLDEDEIADYVEKHGRKQYPIEITRRVLYFWLHNYDNEEEVDHEIKNGRLKFERLFIQQALVEAGLTKIEHWRKSETGSLKALGALQAFVKSLDARDKAVLRKAWRELHSEFLRTKEKSFLYEVFSLSIDLIDYPNRFKDSDR